MTTMQNLDLYLLANVVVKDKTLEFDMNLIKAREACLKVLKETTAKDKSESENDLK